MNTLIPVILLTLMLDASAETPFYPWVEDIRHCAAKIEDQDLKRFAQVATSYCKIPSEPILPQNVATNTQIISENLQRSQRKMLASESTGVTKPLRLPTENEKILMQKRDEEIKKTNQLRFTQIKDFQEKFLKQLEDATKNVENDFLSSGMARVETHEALAKEMSDKMKEINQFCNLRGKESSAKEIEQKLLKLLEIKEYRYLLSNSDFASKVMYKPGKIVGNNGRIPIVKIPSSAEVCKGGESPFYRYDAFRTDLMFHPNVLKNISTKIKSDLKSNRDRISEERQLFKSCSTSTGDARRICLDEIEKKLAEDLSTYGEGYFKILPQSDYKVSSAIMCSALYRAEEEKIHNENMSKLFMVGGLLAIPLSIALPGSGLLLASVTGALTLAESGVGINQYIANREKMMRLEGSLRVETVSKEDAEREKKKLENQNTEIAIGVVTGVASAVGDGIHLASKTFSVTENGVTKVLKESDLIEETSDIRRFSTSKSGQTNLNKVDPEFNSEYIGYKRIVEKRKDLLLNGKSLTVESDPDLIKKMTDDQFAEGFYDEGTRKVYVSQNSINPSEVLRHELGHDVDIIRKNTGQPFEGSLHYKMKNEKNIDQFGYAGEASSDEMTQQARSFEQLFNIETGNLLKNKNSKEFKKFIENVNQTKKDFLDSIKEMEKKYLDFHKDISNRNVSFNVNLKDLESNVVTLKNGTTIKKKTMNVSTSLFGGKNKEFNLTLSLNDENLIERIEKNVAELNAKKGTQQQRILIENEARSIQRVLENKVKEELNRSMRSIKKYENSLENFMSYFDLFKNETSISPSDLKSLKTEIQKITQPKNRVYNQVGAAIN